MPILRGFLAVFFVVSLCSYGGFRIESRFARRSLCDFQVRSLARQRFSSCFSSLNLPANLLVSLRPLFILAADALFVFLAAGAMSAKR